LTYVIASGYPNEFHDPSQLEGLHNSVGLRTCERGSTEFVSLTLNFQRDLDVDDGEPHRLLEQPPCVYVVQNAMLPSGRDRVEFWHRSPLWTSAGTLELCPRQSGALFDVYRWEAHDFSGTAKVDWTPYQNYFQHDEADHAGQRTRNEETKCFKPLTKDVNTGPRRQPSPP
jgi:hypothetical protein